VIALENGKPKVHAHVVLGKADGTAPGGHLMEATVRPTLEIVTTERLVAAELLDGDVERQPRRF
jgi:predicted DNA-binding protein with PD1-like motif